MVASIIPSGYQPEIRYSTIEDADPTDADVQVSDLGADLGDQIGSKESAFRSFFAVLPAGILQGRPAEPDDLIVGSVWRSLGRVNYRLLDPDGSSIFEIKLGVLVSDGGLGSTAALRLMTEPPKGFEPALYLGSAGAKAARRDAGS